MRNQIKENKEFNIISRSIDNAEKCCVIETCEDCFRVKLKNKQKYEKGESVELFAMTNKGQLYFETIIKDVEEDILSIWFPLSFKYLQRREFSRIKIEKNIELKLNNKIIPAKISDISAGGMKIITNEQLELGNNYSIIVNIENKEVKVIFEPIRIEADTNKFISSGCFKNISNYDRISLVQYCFRKQIESNNK